MVIMSKFRSNLRLKTIKALFRIILKLSSDNELKELTIMLTTFLWKMSKSHEFSKPLNDEDFE